MVSLKRVLAWFTLVVLLLVFLLIAGQFQDDRQKWIMLGVIALLAVGLMGTGGGRKVKRVRRRSEMPKSEVEQSKEDDLPAPVKSEEDASTRRDQKLSRSRGGPSDVEVAIVEDEEIQVSLADDVVTVDVIEENVHVAEEFVAEVDAESLEEADIEEFIDERRDQHAHIRRKIEARRREQLAEIRANSAKQYQSADESEDLVALLSTGDHGLTVIEESMEHSPNSPIGAAFVRIDDQRILKIRMPLDEGFIASKDPLPELPPLPDLGDLPLPPLPNISGLPPPPLPAPSKLDALRDEITE
jgi:hypothetical protein